MKQIIFIIVILQLSTIIMAETLNNTNIDKQIKDSENRLKDIVKNIDKSTLKKYYSKRILDRLSKLNHTKLQDLMHRVSKKAPKGYYQCLCNSYSTMGNGIGYSPNGTGGNCKNAPSPCIGGNWGCVYYPLPSDPKVIEHCIKSAKYDDNSTILDVIAKKAIDNSERSKHNSADKLIPSKPKKEVFEPCWNAVVLNDWLQKLKSIRLDVKIKVASLKKERMVYISLRDKAYAEAKLNSPIAKYWEKLASQEKDRLFAARDECKRLKEIALTNAMTDFSRELNRYVAMQREKAYKSLSKKVTVNNQKIRKNKKIIEKISIEIMNEKKRLAKPYGKGQKLPRKETRKIRNFREKKSIYVNKNIALEKENKIAKKALVNPEVLDNYENIIIKKSEMQDALYGQNIVLGQKKDSWAMQEARNDQARRVAEQLFLGMDRAIAESMNPEMILAELSPSLKVKMMQEREEMFDTMARGIDETKLNVILREMPETQEYALKIQDIDNAIMKYNKKMKTIENQYLQGRDLYRNIIRRCDKMKNNGKSLGYDAMYKLWEKRKKEKKKIDNF